MSNTTVPSPPFLSNQRGVSDDAITRRSDTQRSLPNQSSPTADRQKGNRSTSFRSSTFGSLFRSRIDVDSANATPSMPPPAQQQQQQQQRPNSAYYPSQQTMNRPSSSQQGNGSHRPISASFASQQSVRPTQQGIMPPNNSYSYSGMPGGMPAPLPNPYDPSYTPSSFGPPQQQSYQHPPTSAPSSFSNFNRPPPMSAPASYGSQMQHQQQQQGGNNYHYPQNQAISSPPLPPPHPESDADLEAVIRASQESAAEESRKREERQRVEEEHYLALHKSEEQERQRKQAEEEEEMLLKAMQASQLEEEELRRKRIQREREEEEAAQILLEESRQSALREEEERMKRQHAELIERSKREAEEEERKRNHAIEQERLMEEAAMKASLRELEEEWKRREEEERADALHIQQGGQIGDVSYWQNLDEKKAFRLAMEMNKRFDHQSNNVASTSSSSNSAIIRPLPPTPGMAALAAGVELPKMHVINKQGETVVQGNQEEQEWELSDDELIEGEREDDVDDDGQDPFSDKAEAPPMYDDVGNDRPPEAPTSIPSNIQFVRPDYGVQPEHNNTIASINYPSEKSAAISSNITPPSDAIPSTSSHLEQNGIPSHSTPNMTFSHLEQNVTNRSSSNPSRPLPKPRVSSKVLPTLPSVSESSQAPSITITDASSSSQTHSTNQTQETDTTNTPTEESNEFQQRAMKGTDFGYSSEPFGTELFLHESGSNEISTSEPKTRFPNLISLRKANVDGSLRDHSCFFIVRAPSWKALVRALAWYGNTRIEAGPEEVVDHGNSIALRIVIEFVTPSKTSWSQTTIHQNQIAHVSVCFSLAIPSLKEESSKDLLTALKQSSHALDSAYLRQGVTRRVIALPSEAPKLPLDMVNLAQILHRAHTFSAACPSTGATALHSPRDLHHAVERHDVGYVAKLQKKRRDVLATTTTSIPVNNMASTSSNTNGTGKRISSNGENYKRQSGVLQPSNLANNINSGSSNNNNQTNSIGGGMKLPDLTEGGDIDNNDVDQNDGQGDILDAGAVEIVDGDDYGSGRMARLRAHVHRRLGKRSGDPRTVDQDLESWITPYDMTQHG